MSNRTYHTPGGRPGRTHAAAIVGALLTLAACGGSDGGEVALDDSAADVAEATSATATTPTTTTTTTSQTDDDAADAPTTQAGDATATSSTLAVESTTTSTTVDPDLELISLETSDEPGAAMRTYTVSAMGGLQFDAIADHFLYSIGDRVYVTDVEVPGNESPGASIAVISQTPDNSRIETLTDLYDIFASIDGVDLVPDGTAIELFGYQLRGHDVIGETTGLTLFAATRRPGPPLNQWTPGPGKFYAAETPSGVLVAQADSSDADLLARLVTSADLLNGGLDPALAPAVQIAPEGPPPEPGRAIEAGPPTLDTPFSIIEPNRYQIPNFGPPISIEIPEGWETQPNFPGFVVLTQQGSAGPGDRALSFIAGVRRAVVPLAGPTPTGEIATFVEIDELLAAPPAGLMVSDRIETEVGGVPAVRFDLTTADGLDCGTDEPCDFAWTTNWGFTETLRAPLTQRIWWLDTEGPQRFITALSLDRDFIDDATVIVESAEAVG